MGQKTGEAFQREAVGSVPNERGAWDGAHTPWHLRDQVGATQPCVEHQLLLTPCTTDSTVGSPPFPTPTKHTVLSGCAASVTHLERLPLALCLIGFMVLQSSAHPPPSASSGRPSNRWGMQPWALSLPDKELCLREALAVCTPPAPEPSAKRPGS